MTAALPERGPRSARRLASMAAGGLGRLVLLAAVLVLAATYVPSLTLGLHRYVLVGHSMEPTIHRGSLVFDEVVPVEALRRGDVITFVPPGDSKPVSHRVRSLRVTPDGTRVFRTKGDNNPLPDLRPFTLQEPVQARVKFAIPYLGFVYIFLGSPAARLYLLVVPALLLALWALARMWRHGGELLAEQARAESS
jgi:signal peptidase